MNFELCKSLCIDSSYEMFTDCLVLVKGKDFCFILSHFCFNNLQKDVLFSRHAYSNYNLLPISKT